MQTNYKYNAVISVSDSDMDIAKRLKRDLERYVLPRSMRSIIGGRKRISVCIGVSDETIVQSACMVCICTHTYGLDSRWNDITIFMEKTGCPVIPAIYTDTPVEDLPPPFQIIRTDGEKDQVLGPNFIENNKKNRETLRTLSCVIGVSFRKLREAMAKRNRIRWTLSIAIALIIFFNTVYTVDAWTAANKQHVCPVHTYISATCETPAMCSECGLVEEDSEPLGHSWEDGVCTRCGRR